MFTGAFTAKRFPILIAFLNFSACEHSKSKYLTNIHLDIQRN